MKNKVSRRQFLGTASCVSMGALPFFSTWLSMSKLNALAASALPSGNNDYKALVCILLGGGNDSYNMLVPRGNDEYAAYAATRSNQALPQADLLPISTSLQTGLQLGIHPIMTGVQDLYDQGRLAFIANIGTLVEPITLQQFQNGSVPVPVGLYSHSDQVLHWQTSVPQNRSTIGWGGRMADLLSYMNTNQNISMNISLSGNNVFQSGNNTINYSIDSNIGGAESIYGYNGTNLFDQIQTQAINSMLEQEYQNIFKKTYANTIKTGLLANEQFIDALTTVPPLNTTFSDNTFSRDLELIARTIAARDTLDMDRQVFFVQMGGFDNHDELLTNHAILLDRVSKGLFEFQSALDELGVADCVTTFTISDFARTLTSNGNGTDHGWGGNVMIMGDAVNGGEVYGLYPTLALQSNLDIGGGVLIPTTSIDEYFAELSLWMGVPPNELETVLPNITNFYSPGGDLPIGFLNL